MKLYIALLGNLNILKGKFTQDTHGQDLVEYALFAGFIAVLAASSIPTAVTSVGVCFSRIVATLNGVAGGLTGS
jgi:pilus assembly protein Flp/PilA